MSYTDNIRFEFNLVMEKNELYNSAESMINKPITINNTPVGFITEAELDESGLFFNCRGVIWDKFLGIEVIQDEHKIFELSSIYLKPRL